MLHKQLPLPVKFICGFIYSDETAYRGALRNLESRFGRIDFQSQIIDFDFTDYYYSEMGKPLWRRFVSFRKLQNPDAFSKIKSFCINVEKKYACEKKRKVNIDPGYINEAKLVLTTTKDFSHRIYLGKGVYAEVTLYFNKGEFCNFATTFPDYRTQRYKNIFHRLRNIYQQDMKLRGLSRKYRGSRSTKKQCGKAHGFLHLVPCGASAILLNCRGCTCFQPRPKGRVLSWGIKNGHTE